MHIVISDDYQDCIRTLDCYPRLASQFDVTIHNDTVDNIEQQAERFMHADAVILIRERTPISAQLLERLPRLKFISQTGGAASHVDLAACTARGIPVSAAGAASAAELTWALVWRRCARSTWNRPGSRPASGKATLACAWKAKPWASPVMARSASA